MKRFEGKTVLVTGGASGIGLAAAMRLGGEGAAVCVADSDGEGARAATSTLEERGVRAMAVEMDVTDPEAVEAMTGRCAEELGPPDILVASAGIGGSAPMLEMTLELWERVLAVNLTGTFLCTQAAAGPMIRKGWGRIIHLASAWGQRGVSRRAAYGASKGGVIAFMQVVAVELAPHGITVNAICPGPIETPLVHRHHTPAIRERVAGAVPQKRYGTPEEVAAAIAFLASEEAGHITGHQLNIDGGYGGTGIILQEET